MHADGRLQALGIAWDARPKAQGGQRWFHLYPDEKLHAGDPENVALWKQFMPDCLEAIHRIYRRLGVLPFDYQSFDAVARVSMAALPISW